MIYARDLIDRIKPFIRRKEFMAIVGPRQSGKTTFLEILSKYLIKELRIDNASIKIISFEDRRLLAQFEADPISFVRSYLPGKHAGKFYLMIDEFQYATDGGQKLKLVYDTVKDVKIIITGSSSLDIRARVGKFMVGRMLIFYLYPFNFRELLSVNSKRLENLYHVSNAYVRKWLLNRGSMKAKKGNDIFSSEMVPIYEEYALWGGYPAVVTTNDRVVKRKILADIYNNYILKDIKTLLELATERNLYLLSQNLAAQVGNIVVYQNLSQASGLNFRNLRKHLNILHETYICQEVRPFFRNRQKELTKNPKIYFLDMGFRNNLMDNFNDLAQRADAGAVIENAVFIRLNEIHQGIEKINFWRTKAGAEVDFILHKGASIIPVEVKYSAFNTEKISRSFASFINSFAPRQAMVLTKNFWGFLKYKKTDILFVPLYYL